MTSRSADSAAMTGSHERRESPWPCRRISGSPWPVRSYASRDAPADGVNMPCAEASDRALMSVLDSSEEMKMRGWLGRCATAPTGENESHIAQGPSGSSRRWMPGGKEHDRVSFTDCCRTD